MGADPSISWERSVSSGASCPAYRQRGETRREPPMIAQDRYLAHQSRKAQTLLGIMRERHSHRVFSDQKVEDETVAMLTEAVILSPSSCDRKAIRFVRINDRDNKALLGGVLVGGVGWIHRAPEIFLLMADT